MGRRTAKAACCLGRAGGNRLHLGGSFAGTLACSLPNESLGKLGMLGMLGMLAAQA